MKDDKKLLNENSRSQLRSKRRKTNIILNSLIVIVLLLIVVVSVNIFFGDDQKAAEDKSNIETASGVVKNDSETANKTEQAKTEDRTDDESSGSEEKDEELKADEEELKEDEDEKDLEDVKDEEIVTEGGSDPDVNKTIVNPAWEPVGTVQTGQHANVYGGVDWDEMVQAISYATGIDQGNMTILFLGNNGPNKSVGTIKQKDTGQQYRVYIEWVDEKGWKPTLVEELH